MEIIESFSLNPKPNIQKHKNLLNIGFIKHLGKFILNSGIYTKKSEIESFCIL